MSLVPITHLQRRAPSARQQGLKHIRNSPMRPAEQHAFPPGQQGIQRTPIHRIHKVEHLLLPLLHRKSILARTRSTGAPPRLGIPRVQFRLRHADHIPSIAPIHGVSLHPRRGGSEYVENLVQRQRIQVLPHRRGDLGTGLDNDVNQTRGVRRRRARSYSGTISRHTWSTKRANEDRTSTVKASSVRRTCSVCSISTSASNKVIDDNSS